MTGYTYDINGYYIDTISCQASPLEKGKFLIPAYSTLIPPLEIEENKENKFNGVEWKLVDSREYLKKQRQEAFELLQNKLNECNKFGARSFITNGEDGYLERAIEDIEIESLQFIKKERNNLLCQTDFVVLPDADVSPECLESFKVYRQALRDIFEVEIDINTFEFPEKPAYIKGE